MAVFGLFGCSGSDTLNWHQSHEVALQHPKKRHRLPTSSCAVSLRGGDSLFFSSSVSPLMHGFTKLNRKSRWFLSAADPTCSIRSNPGFYRLKAHSQVAHLLRPRSEPAPGTFIWLDPAQIWILIWQTGADRPSAFIPCGLWARIGCLVQFCSVPIRTKVAVWLTTGGTALYVLKYGLNEGSARVWVRSCFWAKLSL